MVQDTRELNRSMVLTELLRSRPSSRKQLSLATGISQPTVTRVVDELILDRILLEGEEIVVESRGRRARSLDLLADRAYAIGIDMGASNTRLLLTDLLGRPITLAARPTPSDLGPAELAGWVCDLLRTHAGAQWAEVSQIALGLPGAVSQEDLTVSNAPNLRQIEGTAFVTALLELVSKPLQIDNDANYALLGEQRFGAAMDAPNAAMLTLGAGLGGALAIDGRLVAGTKGLVGEFGQLPVGPMGSRLEQLVTGPGIMRRAAEANVHLEDPSSLFEPNTTPPVRALRAQFDQGLLVVLMALVVSCEPSTIVMGGAISKSLSGDLSQYEELLRSTLRYTPRITTAVLGDYSGAVGAAVQGLHAEYLAMGVSRDALTSLPSGPAVTVDTLAAALSSPRD